MKRSTPLGDDAEGGHENEPDPRTGSVPSAEANSSLPTPAGDASALSEKGPSSVKRLSARALTLLVLATFGGGMAAIVPMAYSLAVRLDQLAPGREELLGYVIGAGSLVSLIAAPLIGILSDRTRSRWGRRRPYTIGGALVGIASIPVMIWAPNVPLLAVGWALSTLGWGTALGSVGNFQADRLPPQQRGTVSALTGLMMHIGPVVGIVLAGAVRDQVVLVFALPAAIGAGAIALFVMLVHEEDTRDAVFPDRLSLGRVLASFGFNPRRERAFAWNWLGRFVFSFGLSLTTSYSTFFYAQRLNLEVPDVASVLALTSVFGVVSAFAGATSAGWLSDRFRSRRPFLMAGAVIFAAGTAVSAFAQGLTALVAGAFLASLGIAAFSAVGQALVLDVLPHRETQAGRFMAIMSFAQKVPSALAPLVAPLLLSIAAVGADRNYTLLYLCSGALALVGGLIILLKVREPG